MVDDRIVIDPAKYETYMAEAFPDMAQYRQTKIDEAVMVENLVETEQPAEKRARLEEQDNVVDDDNTTERSNQMICKGNDTSLMKSSFQRNINNCFNELMTMNEQHTHAKINLQAEYKAKLEQMQRNYDQRVEETKKKCFNEVGF